ncbi:putative glyoxylate reductase [Microsporum ferrugineum]
MACHKPKVLCLSYPEFTDKTYLDEFQTKFELHSLSSPARAGLVPELAARVSKDGPYDAVVVRMGTMVFEPFDEELFKPLVPHCKIIASASAGYNEFDVEWMSKNGIWFCNSRDAVSECTADMAIFLILAILKNASVAERSANEGLWRGKVLSVTKSPRGMTLGIIGMGSIGKHLARRASAFDMKIKYYNRNRLPADVEAQYNATYCQTLGELLSCSDIISVNCPLNGETTGLLGRDAFKQMKDGVYFVNTARGRIVDEEALVEALKSGKVKMAGLDVFPNEPAINPFFVESDQCIVQPHLGGYTDGAYRLSELECFENIKAWFATGVPISPVNRIEKR